MKRQGGGNAGPGSSERSSGWQIGAFLLATLLVSFAWTPVAAADGSTHTVCIGDSQAITNDSAELGTGCARGDLVTEVQCTGSGEDRICELWADYHRVAVTGVGTCGNVSSPWGDINASTCKDSTNAPPVQGFNQTNRTHLRNYTADEIPFEGRTVVINATVCVWPDGRNETRFCQTYNHTDHLPGDRSERSGIDDDLEYIVKSQKGYTVTTVNSSHPPAGVRL